MLFTNHKQSYGAKYNNVWVYKQDKPTLHRANVGVEFGIRL
jgi:hypothetical protein